MGSGLWLGARSAASDGSDGPTRLSGAGAEGGEKVTIIMNNSRTSVRTLSRIIPVSVVAGGGGCCFGGGSSSGSRVGSSCKYREFSAVS